MAKHFPSAIQAAAPLKLHLDEEGFDSLEIQRHALRRYGGQGGGPTVVFVVHFLRNFAQGLRYQSNVFLLTRGLLPAKCLFARLAH